MPESFILGNGTYSAPIPNHQPAQTITSNDNQTGVRAYLVESKNANQQYGDGILHQGEPHTTVITDHKPSHQPKALLLSKDKGDYSDGHRWGEEPAMTTTANDAGRRRALLAPGGNASSFSTRDGCEPARTAESTNRVGNIPRATTPAGRVVRMTPRCLARFQSVPDWYVLPEKTALACRIIGNGVPCLMMQRVLESLR